jgi:SNF2 family DNA or RNA helicase
MTSQVLKARKRQLIGSNGALNSAEEPKSVPWEPLPYMKKCVKHLLTHGGGGLFLEPGMKKTSITLAALKILKQEGILKHALIIAPKRPCYMVWPAEIKKWADFNGLSYQILHGKDKEWAVEQDADLYIINPDGLPWLMHGDRWRKLHCDTLVIDESSKFKRTSTQRFKLLKPALSSFKRRWILTGSPNPNGYLDLFGQIFICDMGNALGAYITHYRMNYFFPTGYGGYTWKLKPGAEKLIQARIKPMIMSLDAKDYLEVPEVVEDNIRVELPDKARKIYDEMEAELISEIDGNVVTAVNSAASMTKCAQIANGGLYTHEDNGSRRRGWAMIHDAKTEALLDLYEELQGSPLFIAYEFEHDVARIRNLLGKNIPLMGEFGMTQDLKIESDWNAGKLNALLGHPASMGHGLNLQYGGCKHVCFYGLTYDFEQYDQTIRRFRRHGNQHGEVFVHHIIARNTVDEAKLRALKTKDKGQRGLMLALRSYVHDKRK